jgi:transglutaminase-like putative cysteine protease
MSFLQPTYFFDFRHKAIQNLIDSLDSVGQSEKEKVVSLYEFVRDKWLYDPYTISLSKENFKASKIAEKTSGNCVEKSILLIALLRAVNIPARLHLGKVKNHLAVERLTEKFGSNELTPHGMVNAKINGKWLKMSPAFNKTLCEKFSVEPLEFDGENDSFLQQFNSEGNLFMEYLEDYGFFDDVPLDFMKSNVKEHYPHIFLNRSKTEFKL